MGFKALSIQEPNLKPFFVSFANAGDASWAPSELEVGWLADDVVTLDDDSMSPLGCDDEDSGPWISLEELSSCAIVLSIMVVPTTSEESEQAQNSAAHNGISCIVFFMFISPSLNPWILFYP